MPESNWNLLLAFAGLWATSITTVWGLSIWLGKEFTKMKDIIFTVRDALVDKIEYHERHDDARFSDINKELWGVKLVTNNMQADIRANGQVAQAALDLLNGKKNTKD